MDTSKFEVEINRGEDGDDCENYENGSEDKPSGQDSSDSPTQISIERLCATATSSSPFRCCCHLLDSSQSMLTAVIVC